MPIWNGVPFMYVDEHPAGVDGGAREALTPCGRGAATGFGRGEARTADARAAKAIAKCILLLILSIIRGVDVEYMH